MQLCLKIVLRHRLGRECQRAGGGQNRYFARGQHLCRQRVTQVRAEMSHAPSDDLISQRNRPAAPTVPADEPMAGLRRADHSSGSVVATTNSLRRLARGNPAPKKWVSSLERTHRQLHPSLYRKPRRVDQHHHPGPASGVGR